MPCGTLAEAEPFLKGLMYPATKQDILEQAKKNNADEPILETLDAMDKEEFYSHQDVIEALGEILGPRSK